MRWRLRSTEFQRSSKEERIAKLEELVRQQVPVGILAYASGEPIGWCSVAPRETFSALQVSRKLPPLDDIPVWSVTCFFVDRQFRRQNLTVDLLRAAVDYAFSQGALAVEGYPVPPDSTSYTFMGAPSTFLKAGFVDVTPEGQQRVVMRSVRHTVGVEA